MKYNYGKWIVNIVRLLSWWSFFFEQLIRDGIVYIMSGQSQRKWDFYVAFLEESENMLNGE